MTIGHAWGFGHAFGPDASDTYPERLIYGGGLGVFVFFALTGYLLYWPFARRDLGDGRAIDLTTYARNRFLRVMPLYWVAVVLLLVVQEGGGSAEQWLIFLTLTENFSSEHIATVDPVLWSLVVEIVYYALLPLLALAIARVARGSTTRAAAVLGVLGLGALAVRLHWIEFGSDEEIWRYNLPANFVFFIPGMLLAVARVHWGDRAVRGHADHWVLGALATWLVACADADLAPLMLVSGFLLVGACVLPLRAGRLVRLLDLRWLAAIGVVSYSLYVWHWPIIDALAEQGFGTAALMTAGVAVSIAVAFVSYRLVEAPFLRLRRRWAS